MGSTPRTRRKTPAPNAPASNTGSNTGSNNTKAIKVKQEEEEEEEGKRTKTSPVAALDAGYESDAPIVIDSDTSLELQREKESYPGASTWAEDEEHLFEILFQRGERPILPGHWDVDFRGIPVVDTVFQTDNDGLPPVVYARSGKDFQDLTSSVRTTVQSGLRDKAPLVIKRSLDRYLAWAAEDGGFSGLRIVPNIFTAVLDPQLSEQDITAAMQRRMRALATMQREFLKVDRDETFWAVNHVALTRDNASAALLDKYLLDMGADKDQQDQKPMMLDRQEEEAGPAADQDGPAYRRVPPVVYGLFVLRSSVFLLTVDSAKGDTAYVSFHVDVHFMDRHQSVWNALTVAIPVCLARDQLVERLDEFEEWPVEHEGESDG
ncbi:hypothetical protein UVI_02018920 [Ustilaginoidea virens]|uniref:Uncharacterized protein n=1 Tax=Ustilaginoidea virens TaxID=1159556 RepID=A0A1B5KXJ6_USTVR|nr:hypothetical protein UVI_02018920 [Ustilaginoidea virens]